MPSAGESEDSSQRPSVFLSYASEDRAAATSIRDAMAAAGLEVWYDENELGGGDAWDKKIRKQIRECDFFMALISARTEARHEGYFRREWRLAVERTLDMADDHPFLLPVAIDDTEQARARVPEKFLAVQWLKVPEGRPSPALSALCSRLLSGTIHETPAPRKATARRSGDKAAPAPPTVVPPLPTEEPGHKVRYLVDLVGWAARSAWIVFRRLPRWLRVIISLWLFLTFVGKSCSSDHTAPARLSTDDDKKLKAIAEKYQGSAKPGDIAKLGLDIAHEVAKESADTPDDNKPLLVVPFTIATRDTPAAKLADTTFAQLYGRLSLSHQGQVGLSKDPLQALDVGAAVERGHASHSSYVISGGTKASEGNEVLTIEITKVSDGIILWTKDYPAAGSDPATIASEVEAKVPSVEDN
jgi:TolB-like protein